jgi:hypothetical protein
VVHALEAEDLHELAGRDIWRRVEPELLLRAEAGDVLAVFLVALAAWAQGIAVQTGLSLGTAVSWLVVVGLVVTGWTAMLVLVMAGFDALGPHQFVNVVVLAVGAAVLAVWAGRRPDRLSAVGAAARITFGHVRSGDNALLAAGPWPLLGSPKRATSGVAVDASTPMVAYTMSRSQSGEIASALQSFLDDPPGRQFVTFEDLDGFYVQFAMSGSDATALYGEVVSNAHLPRERQVDVGLDAGRQRELLALGWEAPSSAAGDNFSATWKVPIDIDRVVTIVEASAHLRGRSRAPVA